MTPSKLAGWAGIVFSVLSVIVIPMVGAATPPLGASPEAFATWFTAHRTGFLVGNFLGIAAFLPGFVQLAVLVARIRARDREDGWLATFVLATGIFTYTVFACSLVAFQALPFLVDPHAPQATSAIGTLAVIWFALDGLVAIAMIVAVAWAALATGVLPRWFAHLSWVFVAICLVMSLGSIFDEPAWLAAGSTATLAGFGAFFVWTGILAGIQLRE